MRTTEVMKKAVGHRHFSMSTRDLGIDFRSMTSKLLGNLGTLMTNIGTYLLKLAIDPVRSSLLPYIFPALDDYLHKLDKSLQLQPFKVNESRELAQRVLKERNISVNDLSAYLTEVACKTFLEGLIEQKFSLHQLVRVNYDGFSATIGRLEHSLRSSVAKLIEKGSLNYRNLHKLAQRLRREAALGLQHCAATNP